MLFVPPTEALAPGPLQYPAKYFLSKSMIAIFYKKMKSKHRVEDIHDSMKNWIL